MENNFFGRLGKLQDSHVGVIDNSVRCYGLRGLTFILNLTFIQRLDQIDLDSSPFVNIEAHCSY